MNVQIHKIKLVKSVFVSLVLILIIFVLFLFDRKEIHSLDLMQNSFNSKEEEIILGSRSPKSMIVITVRRIQESFKYQVIQGPIAFPSFFKMDTDDICYFSDFDIIALENNIYVGYIRYTNSLIKIDDDLQEKSQYIGEAYVFAESMVADAAENLNSSYFVDTTLKTCYFIIADEAEKLSECYLSINESDFAG